MRIQGNNPFIPTQWQKIQPEIQSRQTEGFAAALKSALSDVNKLQLQADESVKKLAMGQGEDIHQVMIAVEQAKLAMQLTVQVRNKVVEAYQEISRMQI
ncbi:MAG: Flagellar hook-basal body complex protein FliE [Dehalococcoidia bacterium]|nr:Flagellar hook-basal body complex protein FliE [Bacillota bacterium]MBT9143115.1 Flagellar hook-basal body complex protein FliE [Bacillota bacterium]